MMHFQPVPPIKHGELAEGFDYNFAVYVLAKDYLCEQFTEIFGPKDDQWSQGHLYTTKPEFHYAVFGFRTEAQLLEAYLRFNGAECQ